MENFENEKFKRAKKRVDEIKGFYIHLAVYVGVNVFILANIVARSDSFWEWGHFITPFFWGIGLLFHAAHTFKYNPLFGKNWEERQIQKFMDKDREEAKKYRR
ncbi:MAG: 2TM domain-containing protein [Bacteroidota bacterium]